MPVAKVEVIVLRERGRSQHQQHDERAGGQGNEFAQGA